MAEKLIAKFGAILAENVELSFKRKDIGKDISEPTRQILENCVKDSLNEFTKEELIAMMSFMIGAPTLFTDLLEDNLGRNSSETNSKG